MERDPCALESASAGPLLSRRQAIACLGAAVSTGGRAEPARPWLPVPGVVRLARPHFFVTPKDWYPFQLLELALAASGGAVELRAVDRMTDARALIELASPTAQVDVVVSMNAPEREARFLVVPAPIYAGLFGWRLLAVRDDEATRALSLRGLDELQTLTLGQGEDWPDVEVLKANGLRVRTAKTIGLLYEDLRAGRIDAFPRGVTEVWRELSAMGAGLTVMPGLALQYRRDLFFHVRPELPELAQRIENGLRRLRRNGSWRQLLQAHTQGALKLAGLERRRVIALKTPGLSPALQRIPAAWWRPS